MDKLRGMKTPQLVREWLAEFMGTLILCVSSMKIIFNLLNFFNSVISGSKYYIYTEFM